MRKITVALATGSIITAATFVVVSDYSISLQSVTDANIQEATTKQPTQKVSAKKKPVPTEFAPSVRPIENTNKIPAANENNAKDHGSIQQPEELKQLYFLQSCYDESIIDCGYPNNDPRQTSFLIGQDIKNELQSLLDHWNGGEIDEKVLSQAALESLANPDGHVQQAALEVLSELPPSQSHYNSMLETLAASYNAKIIKLIMLEAQRYKAENASGKSDQIFIQQLKTGAPYASQEVAKNLLPFFNEYNIGSYKQTLKKLSAKTKKAQILKANIEEYERMQAGG